MFLELLGTPGCGPAGLHSPTESSYQDVGLAKDGNLAISAPGMVLNRYAVLAADARPGDDLLVLANQDGLGLEALLPLVPDDLLLIIQMQGAAIDTSDTPNYGQVTDLRGAGSYEFIHVAAVNPDGTIKINGGCGGLANRYQASLHTQVLRVPQYANLTIEATGSVTAKPWDGQTGGVAVLQLRDTLRLDGTVDVSGIGFRGGARNPHMQDRLANVGNYYLSPNAADGGNRGEGIAGFQTEYAASGPYGRGAAANGGGAGNRIAAGGGGGGNGGDPLKWNGQGEMSMGVPSDLAAWRLDPGYDGTRTVFPGGGRGGYTFSDTPQDATLLDPGDPGWGGDLRRERGGLGGRPVPNEPSARLFLGGGGGSGDDFLGASGSGGNGGGLVFIAAQHLVGSGQILANGQAGGAATATNAGAGGGGAGGTVLLAAASIAGVSIQADGGSGGSQQPATAGAAGPGGGGGGGYVSLPPGVAVARSANPGRGGTTASTDLLLFAGNGASDGGAGVLVDNALGPYGTAPNCSVADVTLTLAATPAQAHGLDPFELQVSAQNLGPSRAGNLAVRLDVPDGVRLSSLTASGWECQVSAAHLDCTLAALLAGTSSSFTLTMLPPIRSSSTMTFKAAVSTQTPDPEATNNSASLTVSNDAPVTPSLGGGGLSCTLSPTPHHLPGTLPGWLLFPAALGLIARRRAGKGRLPPL